MARRVARPDNSACHCSWMNPMPLPFRPSLTYVPLFARMMGAAIP